MLNILRRLQAQLDQAIPIAQRLYNDALGSDQDSTSSISSDSESDASSDGKSNSKLKAAKSSKIAVLSNHIFEQVRSLQHLSMLLRRRAIGDWHIRSKRKTSRDQDYGARYEYLHVEEKVRQFWGHNKSSR